MLFPALLTILIMAGLAGLYFWAIHPNASRRRQCQEYAAWRFAHRGLWSREEGIPENSVPAYREAIRNHYAIELDVHLTRDGRLAVFHDDTLSRMCGAPGSVESYSWEELQEMRLDGTDQKIPLLEDVLELVDGRVPLLIELKVPNSSLALCPVAARALDRYSGPYIIESFQPFALRWFRKNRPDVLVGQLASRYGRALKVNSLFKLLSSSLMVHVVSRPDFVAYNFRTADGLGIDLNQHLFRIPVFAWTVRSEEEYETCRENQFSTVIFEGFHPEVKEIPALPEKISDRMPGQRKQAAGRTAPGLPRQGA